MRGLWWIEEPEFQCLRFVFSPDGDESVEDVFEGSGGAGPDARKGLAMNREFADETADGIGAEVEIGQSRVAANGQRRVESRRKAKAGLS